MTDPDQRTIRKDDRLLDRLGRDLPTSKDGDDVELMLAAWRRSMPDAGPPDPGLVAAITAPAARPGGGWSAPRWAWPRRSSSSAAG